MGYKAWNVWSKYPQWAVTAAEDGELENSPPAGDKEKFSQKNNSAGASAVQSDLEVEAGSSHEDNVRRTPTASPGRKPIGSRNMNLLRQEEWHTQAVRSMAYSGIQKSGALEERNAIAIFSRSEAAGMPEKESFFAAYTYFLQALKRARVASQEEGSSSAEHAAGQADALSATSSAVSRSAGDAKPSGGVENP